MSKAKLTWRSVGPATLIAVALMASAGSASAADAINPALPILGVKCSSGTTQVTDTVARIDAICTVPQATWKDVICAPLAAKDDSGNPLYPDAKCDGPPEVTDVIPKPEQIPVPTDDPTGPGNLCLSFCSDTDPPEPNDNGRKFEDCLSNPDLAYCKTDPVDPPTTPDPNGPEIEVIDVPKNEDASPEAPKGFHCDPHIWTNNDLVSAASITLPGESTPIDAYILNPDFPQALLPPGDSNQVPPLPSFLSTATGKVDINGTKTDYWLDDPRGDSSAYINPDDQGCVNVPNTRPTQLAADGISPSADADSTPGQVAVSWSAWTSPDGVLTIDDLAVDGGSAISSYVVHALNSVTGVDTGLTCTADVALLDTGCSFKVKTATTPGLEIGTNYIFRVAPKNSVGEGPLSAPTDPAVTPQPPLARKGKRTKARPSVHSAAKKKVAKPGPPTEIGFTQCKGSNEPVGCPSNRGIIVTWKAPKSNGGKPITGYYATVEQVDGLGKGTGKINKTCTPIGTATQCAVDGLRRNYYDTIYVTAQAKNAKGLGAQARTYKKMGIRCDETIDDKPKAYEQVKCMYTVKVKVIVRISGRDASSGSKTRIGCQLAPFVARTIVKMRNPAYPTVPGQVPELTLGEAINGICRISFTQIKKPVLNPAQKALAKKGYTVMQLKINGLPSKGTRERPIGLPWAITRVENKNAIPVNGGRDPRTDQPMLMGDGTYLQNLKVVSDANGILTWIGVVKKKGYYPIIGGWPFYKSGKTFFVFPKSKAKK